MYFAEYSDVFHTMSEHGLALYSSIPESFLGQDVSPGCHGPTILDATFQPEAGQLSTAHCHNTRLRFIFDLKDSNIALSLSGSTIQLIIPSSTMLAFMRLFPCYFLVWTLQEPSDSQSTAAPTVLMPRTASFLVVLAASSGKATMSPPLMAFFQGCLVCSSSHKAEI